jgi:hypothetical protein
MTFDTVTVIVIAAGILLMMVSLKMAHAVIHYVNKKMVNRGHI